MLHSSNHNQMILPERQLNDECKHVLRYFGDFIFFLIQAFNWNMESTNEILYIVDALTCIMKNRFTITILVGVLAVLCGLMYSTTISTASAQLNYSIKVAKTSEGDFTVINGASYVGSTFNTTYTMTGTAPNFTKARDTLITSIIDDFDKSSTIGYIKMNNTHNQSSGNITYKSICESRPN